jgi:hypothetical protein
MKHQKTLIALALITSAAVTDTTHASLVDRGNGLLYDDVLNVTWLQDANYAHTSGYASAQVGYKSATGGAMDWMTATTWAANLVYGGFSDWRLATNTPVSGGASYNIAYSVNGSTDVGYNITSPNAELAYMYNVNLGLKDYVSATNVNQSTFGVFGNGNTGGQANVGLVKNLQSYAYWSGAEYSQGYGNDWNFDTSHGNQVNGCLHCQLYAWAVRPGDVSAVPVPGAVWLFGSALLGLSGFRRKVDIESMGSRTISRVENRLTPALPGHQRRSPAADSHRT